MPRHIMRSTLTSRNQGGGKSKAGTGRSVGLYLGAGKARAGIRRILRKIAKSWKQMGNDIDGEDSYDESGYSVSISIDGTRVAIGAQENDGNGEKSGHVRVFEYNGSDWVQMGLDIDGESGGVDYADHDRSGWSVSLSGDGERVAIGAPYNNGNGQDSGHVRVFEYNGTDWVQLGLDIDGENEDDRSGYSVSISNDGTRVAIGARRNDGNGEKSGHVRVFEYNGTDWVQLGLDIDGEEGGAYDQDESGWSVSLSGDGTTVAIGAPYNDGNGKNSGHVRVFKYNGTEWVQMGLDIDGESGGGTVYYEDQSGDSVSISNDGTRVAIGASYNNGNGRNSGHVRVFEYNGTDWVQMGEDIDGEEGSIDQIDRDESGWSVSLSGDGTRVAIGAPFNDGNGQDSGHVRVFEYNGTDWVQLGLDIDGEEGGANFYDQDRSGWSVSLSRDGTTVAIGAPYNNGNGEDSGQVRVFEYK